MNSIVNRAARCLLNLHTEHRILSLSQGSSHQRILLSRSWSTAKPDKQAPSEAKGEESATKTEEAAASEIVDEAQKKASEEITKLNESLAEMKDKYQRSIAENENVRKRLRKEISDSKVYAIQGFCKDLLDVADVLDTAIHTVPKDMLQAKNDPHHKQWIDFFEGISTMQKELLHVFQRHGLVPFKPVKGDKFDPKFHDAMFQAADPELKTGLIAHVQNTGYTLHERTLRPAKVGVSK